MTISRLYFHGIDVCKLLTMNATLLVWENSVSC